MGHDMSIVQVLKDFKPSSHFFSQEDLNITQHESIYISTHFLNCSLPLILLLEPSLLSSAELPSEASIPKVTITVKLCSLDLRKVMVIFDWRKGLQIKE